MAVACLGELIVDMVAEEPSPDLGGVQRFRRLPGGAPANVAVGLKHHGVLVTLISRVGKDSHGDFLIRYLQQQGLSTVGITRDARYRTKIALVGRTPEGERFFEFHNLQSADQHIKLQYIPMKAIRNANIFHFGGVALLGETTALTTLHLLQQMRPETVVTFDPNIRLDLIPHPDKIRMRLAKILQYVQVLKCSLADYAMLFSDNPPPDIPVMIITNGSQPTMLKIGKKQITIPPPEVQVVDTTGAGDAFMAALLARLDNWIQRLPFSAIPFEQWQEWVDWANQWGAYCVQTVGAVACYNRQL